MLKDKFINKNKRNKEFELKDGVELLKLESSVS